LGSKEDHFISTRLKAAVWKATLMAPGTSPKGRLVAEAKAGTIRAWPRAVGF